LGAGTVVGLGTGAAVGNSEVVGAGSTEAAGLDVVASAAVPASTVTRPVGGSSTFGLEFNVQPARNVSASKQIRPRVNGDGYTMKTILDVFGFHH
jgi:hypothetical protein